MKTSILSMLLAFFAVGLDAQAKMVFEKNLVDIGTVESGQTVPAVFHFSNQGQEKLVIGNIQTDCGCTAAHLEKREYQPGEKGSIRIDFNTRGYNGRVIKNTVVSTNDPDFPQHRLTLRAEVLLKDFPAGRMQPDSLSFSGLRPGQKQSRKITISNSGNLDLIVYEVTHSPEIETSFQDKIIAPGRAVELQITFRAFSAGRISNLLRIRTNDPQKPQFLIRIEAEISG